MSSICAGPPVTVKRSETLALNSDVTVPRVEAVVSVGLGCQLELGLTLPAEGGSRPRTRLLYSSVTWMCAPVEVALRSKNRRVGSERLMQVAGEVALAPTGSSSDLGAELAMKG